MAQHKVEKSLYNRIRIAADDSIGEDRFDMEQKIINFGSILDDLKLVNDYIGDDRIDALIKLYQLKYDDLWNCFEKVIENGTT